MTLLRASRNDFAGAIAAAAPRLGLDPYFIEKDYWVTQTLRALCNVAPGAFVFKGGTSLSKGYGLIERFSEDVDILITPAIDDSNRKRGQRLERLTDDVAQALELSWQPARPPGRGKAPHRGDLLIYEQTVPLLIEVPGEHRGVLLETGFAGGEWPTQMVSLRPLLADALELAAGDYEDTDAFSVRALHPARTLVEKASLMHDVATRFLTSETTADDRCGRHYYDIYRLLSDSRVVRELERRHQFDRLVEEMHEISAAHYGTSTPRPERGYAASPAFQPDDPELREWLTARYDDARPLLHGDAGSWPTFEDVLQLVSERAELL